MKSTRIFPLLLITLATIIAPRMVIAQTPKYDTLFLSPDCGSDPAWDFGYFNNQPQFVNKIILTIDTTGGVGFGGANPTGDNIGIWDDSTNTIGDSLTFFPLNAGGIGTAINDSGFYFILGGLNGNQFPFGMFDHQITVCWYTYAGNKLVNSTCRILTPTLFQGNCTFDTVTASATIGACDPYFNFNVFNHNPQYAISGMKFEVEGITTGSIRPGNVQAPQGWNVDSVTQSDAYFSTSCNSANQINHNGNLNGFIVPLRANPAATAFTFVWTAYNCGSLIDRDTIAAIPAKPQLCSEDGNPDSVTFMNNGGCNFTAEVKDYHNDNDTVSVITNWTFTIKTPGVTFGSATNPTQEVTGGLWANSGVGTQTLSFFEVPKFISDPQYAQPGGTIWTPRFSVDNPNNIPFKIEWVDSNVTQALSSGDTNNMECNISTPDTAWILAGSNACCNTLVVGNAHTLPSSSIHAIAINASAGTFIANSCSSSNGWTPNVPGSSARFTNLTGNASNDLKSGAFDTIHFCVDPAQPNTPWTLTWTTIDPTNNNLYSNTITVPGCTPPLVCDAIQHSQSTAVGTCSDTITVFNMREGGATIDSVTIIPMGGWSIEPPTLNRFWPDTVYPHGDTIIYVGTIPIQPETSQGFVVSYNAPVGTSGQFNVEVETHSGGVICSNTHLMNSCQGTEGVSSSGPPQTLDVSVVPNPMNQEAQITLTTGVFDRVQIALLDVLGRTSKTVIDGTISAGDHSYTLDVSQLPMGTYYLRIEASGATLTKKLVIEH